MVGGWEGGREGGRERITHIFTKDLHRHPTVCVSVWGRQRLRHRNAVLSHTHFIYLPQAPCEWCGYVARLGIERCGYGDCCGSGCISEYAGGWRAYTPDKSGANEGWCVVLRGTWSTAESLLWLAVNWVVVVSMLAVCRLKGMYSMETQSGLI